MKINFLGGFFPSSKINEYESNTKGAFHHAADALQKSIIEGLKLNNTKPKLITVPFLTNFPSYKYLIVKGQKNKTEISIPFLNLKFFDSYSKSFNLRKILKKELTGNNTEVLLIYGMFDYFLRAIPKNNTSKVCLIVPDLPRMMGGDLNKIHIKLYINFIEKIILKNIHKVDAFVLISRYMTEFIDIKDKPFVVVEGIYNNQLNIPEQTKENQITILYTGTLAKRYGILNLLNAFNTIQEKQFVLWICGDGDGKKEVELAAKNDSRIKYFGVISNKEALILQKRASILVNPRNSQSDFTKYSFPSKTMEYLASGTPTVMYRLDGIPTEYYKYCFCPEEETDLALKDTLLKVANLSQEERTNFGKEAQQFIYQDKNPKVQVSKILEMMKKLF